MKDIITFDVETTGLQPVRDKMIELAAVRWQDGSVVDTFQSLINPESPIPAEASNVHGITDDEVAGAPNAGEVLERFEAFRGDTPLAAHNAPFDTGFLTMEAARAGKDLRAVRVLDTLPLCRAAFPRFPSHRLERVAEMLRIHTGQSHRALDDSTTAGRVLFEALHELKQQVPDGCWSDWSPTIRKPSRDPMRTLYEAMQGGHLVEVEYTDREGQSRDYELRPLAMVEVLRNRYLHAVCMRADAPRTFRLDRITKARAAVMAGLPF